MSAIIRVTRSNEWWANRLRKFSILINGREVGKVSRGETVEFEIPPGQFDIQAKIDWTGSDLIKGDADDGEVRSFTVSNGDTLGGLFRTDRYLSLEESK
ncbi:hypothetical protein EEW87_17485 (plasmid) [Janibacter melonis]|uniref:Uncharacterized protein n=1 Tax=Janibacter melonis TaxID=262209 RepID=A0A650GER3_9MICO|nr:hypothetical protein [Janibacter melonis]QGX08797.1 hypothetical protein EEW87_17485 [Janibacter melonis]